MKAKLVYMTHTKDLFLIKQKGLLFILKKVSHLHTTIEIVNSQNKKIFLTSIDSNKLDLVLEKPNYFVESWKELFQILQKQERDFIIKQNLSEKEEKIIQLTYYHFGELK